MRCFLPLALCAVLAACSPDRSGIEEVFLEQETAPAAADYEAMRAQVYRTLKQEGPGSARGIVLSLLRKRGPGDRTWELLPLLARLHLADGKPQDARLMLNTARIAHRLSLGELQCLGPGDPPLEMSGAPPVMPDGEIGSGQLVGMIMCPGFQKQYPVRARDAHDALFDRKVAAVEALLNTPSDAARKSS